MADFGLAAQIGRGGGNAMPGAQPQDQTNRMMQMLQLQQLQQNMMLAREQEARQQQLFPLQQEQLRTGTAENAARIGLVGQNTVRATEEAESARRTGTAERGVLDYIRDTPPEERTKPERLDALRKTNPGAYTALTNQINAARVVQEKARAENFSAERQRFEMQRVALLGMSSLLPAVRDQASYETLYSDFKTVDPTGAKLIGPRYTPESVAALRTRLQDLSDIDVKRDEQGNDILINKRDGTIRLLSAAQRPAAAPESTFSNLSGAFAANPSSPQLVGAGAASIPSPNVMATPGATPIIQPRAPAFEGLGPKPVAKGQETTAVKAAESAFDAEVRRRNAREVLAVTSTPEIDKLISRSTSGGLQRAAAGAYEFVTGQSTKGQEAIGQLETIANKLTLDMAGGKLGAGFSNEDRQFLLALLGDVGNPNVGANRRVAAFRQFREGLKAIESGKPLSVVPGSATTAGTAPDVDALLKKYQ